MARRILNLRDLDGDTSARALAERGIARIDRQTPWGNPFRIGRRYGTRAQVIRRYRDHLWRRVRAGDLALEDLAELDGRPLACWCAPKPCHGAVLARAAGWAARTLAAGRAEHRTRRFA